MKMLGAFVRKNKRTWEEKARDMFCRITKTAE